MGKTCWGGHILAYRKNIQWNLSLNWYSTARPTNLSNAVLNALSYDIAFEIYYYYELRSLNITHFFIECQAIYPGMPSLEIFDFPGIKITTNFR